MATSRATQVLTVKLASWIVASHFRPRLLHATLSVLKEALWPAGWTSEIVVAYHENDPQSGIIAADLGAIAVPTAQPTCGGKRNAALVASRGELILVSDDDDFSSPLRPTAAVAAYEAAHPITGIREFRRLHLATGMVIRWCGRGGDLVGGPPMPRAFCSHARNYSREVVMRHGGWRAGLKAQVDSDLLRRIISEPKIVELDLGDMLADTTIHTQHDANIHARPEVAQGQRITFGEYVLVGEGHWTQAPYFPQAVASLLSGILN